MLLTENMIDEWVRARGEAAQGLIVETVWRLVAAASPKPKERRFPLGDSIGQRGRDGVLQVDLGLEPYFPDGRSFWEVGTGVDPADKATRDYRNATRAVPEHERQDSAFIFVTPLSGRRGWDADSQGRWLRRRRGRGDWREVRIIDATVLVDWLHRFPSVEIWLAEATYGINAPDIDVFDRRWNVLRSYGDPPPLTPELFLANRDSVRPKLNAILRNQTARLRLETLYLDQAADFVTAYIADLADDERVDASSRALFVSTSDAWKRLSDLDTQHILVAEASLDLSGDDGTKLIQLAQRGGHLVIHSGLPGGIPDPTSAPLPWPRVEHVEAALRAAGHAQERSRMLAERCAGNLASLKRMLQNLAAMPEWSEGGGASDLAIGMVLGGWKESSPGDIQVVEGISGNSYGAWSDRIRAQSLLAGAPLTQSDGVWKFGPRYEAWYAIGRRLFQPELERIREWVTRALSEIDPQLDLSDDDRPLASVRGLNFTHSEDLRRGLADTVALLGSHEQALVSVGPGVAAGAAHVVVRDLLLGADWRRLASLDRLLPLLAEGAPEAFLDAVERALRGRPNPFNVLFERETSGLMGRTYMSGILWALETLAWRPEYLGRVVLVLGELASQDPGGNWSNRPANSLTTILLPWMPQTLASIEQRLAAVDALIREEAGSAWKLLVSLLPGQTQFSSGSRKPTWRTWIPDDWSDRIDSRQYAEQAVSYAERALRLASDDAGKLVSLIEHFDWRSEALRARALDLLRADSTRELDNQGGALIWTALTALISRHRMFEDAEWAMEPSAVDEIAAVAETLAPSSPDLEFARLFTERGIDLFEKKGDYAEQHEQLEERRDAAVLTILQQLGLDAVMAFASSVATPWRVGLALGRAEDQTDDEVIVPSTFSSEQVALREFGRGYVIGRFVKRGWPWVDQLRVGEWALGDITTLLVTLPFIPDTWARVETLLSNPDEYWTTTPANPYGYKADISGSIDPLIRVGRPFAALRCIHYILAIEKQLLAGPALRALIAGLRSQETRDQMSSFEVAEIIKALQASDDVSVQDVIQIEWAYLPTLDERLGTAPKNLERHLSEDPEFFAEMIRLVFKSTSGEDEERNPAIASNGYHLLTEWSIPPGLKEDGSFDGAQLIEWLAHVSARTRESGREAIAMTMAGHALRHVPADPGGLWIDRSAALVLDDRDADDLRDGFRTAEMNSRGVHFINPTGEDERALADKYRDRAEALSSAGFHRFAGAIRQIEKSYALEGEQVKRREW